jgi:hypothetical protein
VLWVMDSGTSGWRRRESSCGVGGIVGRRGRFSVKIEENETAMQDVQLISERFCSFPKLSCGVAIVSNQKLEAQRLWQIDAKTSSTLS